MSKSNYNDGWDYSLRNMRDVPNKTGRVRRWEERETDVEIRSALRGTLLLPSEVQDDGE